MKNMKILAALFTAAALIATGCPQQQTLNNSSADSSAEKYEFQASTAEPKGVLKVTVQGQAVSVSFETEGKIYSSSGRLGSDGTIASELSNQEDAQNKYGFTGTYDSAKKMFSKVQFGKTGSLKDVDFSGADGNIPRSFYAGTVLGLGLYQYNVTVTLKNETMVLVLFSREVNRRADGTVEQVYASVEGALSGNKVTAQVRLEGEDFTFETTLSGDGYLRETRLIGERASTGGRAGTGAQNSDGYLHKTRLAGERASTGERTDTEEQSSTLIYEYEVKGLDEHMSKNVAEHFKGDLTLTMHVSMERYLAMKDKKQKKSGRYEVGELFVTFRELTDKENTRLYKGRIILTKDRYEKGVAVNLYNLLNRPGIINENPSDKKTPMPGSLGTNNQPVKFVFVARAKDWYNRETHMFKGVTFGRAKTVDKILGKGVTLADKLTLVN